MKKLREKLGPDVGGTILAQMSAIYSPTDIINAAEKMYDMIFPVPQNNTELEEYVKENVEFDYGKRLSHKHAWSTMVTRHQPLIKLMFELQNGLTEVAEEK